MTMLSDFIPNFIAGKMCPALDGHFFLNINPHSGETLCQVARSGESDVKRAVDASLNAQKLWAEKTSIARSDFVREIALRMVERKDEIAQIVSLESGKTFSHAMGETQAAIEMGFFIAGEGRRNYGKTMASTMNKRQVFTVKQPVGVAALITASNTPIANVAWKAFPSIFCGNASIMKPSEDTPGTAWIFADICREVGLPDGIFNVVQGIGSEAGSFLVESPLVDLVSFTGGHRTGQVINEIAGKRLAKVCLELGGKNALTVCDDADIDLAVQWTIASAFSNAGQRCAAASRVVVFDVIYDEFKAKLCRKTQDLTLGIGEGNFLGPVINERQLMKMVEVVNRAHRTGATILTGGERETSATLKNGFYMQPTIIEGAREDSELSTEEVFGPITCLYRVRNLSEAVDLVNNSNFGLTSSIHTTSIHRAMQYAEKVKAGVVVVNGGTHGSEPHMGFGGVKNSGTGWKEAGLEALDVYSDVKYVNLITDPAKV